LGAHARVVLETGGAEDVHQLRVSCARLLVLLQLGHVRVLRDDLRWLRRRVGELRDLDVQLEAEPPARLARALRKQRLEALDAVRNDLKCDRFIALQRALSLLPPVSRERAEKSLQRMNKRTLELGAQKLWRESSAFRDLARTGGKGRTLHALHALRRQVRRLRYAADWLDTDSQKLKDFQEALGEVCNRAMALQKQETDEASLTYHRRLRAELVKHARIAAHEWKNVKPTLEELSDDVVHHSPRDSGPPHGDTERSGPTAH
jgi:CHAD domain-containing protein